MSEMPPTPEYSEWHAAEVIESPPRRRGAGKLVGILVVVLALAGGGAYAVRSVRTSSSGGGSSPEAATRNFIKAAGNEDVLGILGTLLPGERDAIRKPLQDLVAELVRLNVLSGNANLSKVSGVDFSFSGVQLRTSSLDADHAFVETTGGTGRFHVDPSAAPLGSLVRDLMGTANRSPSTENQELTGENAIRLVTVREGGKWYVSMWYSAAENARRDAGGPAPQFGGGLRAIGAASPEAAVREFLDALTTFEFDAVIQRLAPEESAALRDYASSFLNGLASAAGTATDQVSIKLSKLDLVTEARGDESLVKIRSLAFSAGGKGPNAFHLDFDGNCVTGTHLPFPAPRLCADQLRKTAGLLGAPREPADLGFVTVRRDGKWYVSPTRTVLEGITAVLRTMKPQDLRDIASMISRLSGFAGRDATSIAPLLGG